MSNDRSEGEESDIRRRAAWLLAMLVVVAALFVTLMVTFFNGSGASDNSNNQAGSTTPLGPSTSAAPSSGSSAPTGATSSNPSPSTSSSAAPASCPTGNPCALNTDIGNAIAAINAYRAQNGKAPVPGSVSDEAKLCALNNGNGCSGGWAESQVPGPDGAAAVQKIIQFGKLTSDMSSIEVGWAYNPMDKSYNFAIIRKT